jgi:4-amino-4-deoxy-L-arabinose transferase-like glycosyltransferase
MTESIRKPWPLIILLALLLISGLAHATNMFRFPHYENDEGTYMAQAWSLTTEGELAPTTYTYDHAPAGWILIGLWTMLTGGFFTFGFAINSGRVLMLVLHLLSAALLYDIARSVSKSVFAASIAVLIFSLSPLAVYYQRRVLLDNIMVFWLLLAVYLVIKDNRKLAHYTVSAIVFGIAVLTKEPALFFLPAILYIIITNSDQYHRGFAIGIWITVFLSIISYYILFALLKGEFFPSGTPLGGSYPHVSLLSTIGQQTAQRGGFFLDPQSAFMLYLNQWARGGEIIEVGDAPLIIGGGIATAFALILSFDDRKLRYIVFLLLSYLGFLISGFDISALYVIPLIPLLSLTIALSLHRLGEVLSDASSKRMVSPVLAGILLLPFALSYATQPANYTMDHTTRQIDAVKWIDSNIPENSFVLIDNYAFVDLHAKGIVSERTLDNAYPYWATESDAAIRTGLLENDWQNINYILLSPQMSYDAVQDGLTLTLAAEANSVPLMTFPNNGWDIEVREVDVDMSGDIAQK